MDFLLIGYAQLSNVDSIWIRGSLKLHGKTAAGISNDSTAASKDSNRLITEYAAKRYADNNKTDTAYLHSQLLLKEPLIPYGIALQYWRGDKTWQNLATVATTGSYNDLINTPIIPTVPTNVSAFNNDAGYITNSSLSSYLPLAGGTLRGALSGTSATFSSSVTATGFFNSSDIRLKNVLSRSGNGMIAFKWKDKRDNRLHFGYSAQDIQKQYPDLVNTGEKGFLSVNYTELLVKKVDDLESEINALKNEINQLKKVLSTKF